MSTSRKSKVFLNDTTEHLGEGELERVTGLGHYPGRALWMTQPGDVIVLDPALQPSWDWVQGHARRVGIEVTNEVVWNPRFDVVRDFPEHELDVFFFGPSAHRVRPDDRYFNTVRQMNNKNEFVRRARRLGSPVPKTWCYQDKGQFTEMVGFRFPVYVKVAVSVSGMGVTECRDQLALEAAIAALPERLPFQIQSGVDATEFINVGYSVNGHGLERGIVTGQLLKGAVHNGNRFPTVYDPWHTTDPIAQWMATEGMKGEFAFDVAVLRSGGFAPIECNPRKNAAHYPTAVAARLGVNAWRWENMHTGVRSLAAVDLGRLEYNPRTKRGAVVVNWGSVCDGKVTVMSIAPTEAEQLQIAELVEALLA